MTLERRRRALTQKRRELLVSLGRFDRERFGQSETEAISELSSIDNHPGDLGTATFERELEAGIRIEEDRMLSQVEGALHRLDDGSYGRCLICAQPISARRLEAEPWAERCLTCEEASERALERPRPVGEDVLAPPFGRSFRDNDREGTVGYDGEDTWQAVARWGTSNSPSDVPPAVTYDQTYIDFDEDVGTVEPVEKIPEEAPDDGSSNANDT